MIIESIIIFRTLLILSERMKNKIMLKTRSLEVSFNLVINENTKKLVTSSFYSNF